MKFLTTAITVVVSVTLVFAQTRNEATLTEQKICAEGAKEFVGRRYDKLLSYTSHYNKKLNRCFVDITSTLDDKFTLGTIWDVFENRLYADVQIPTAGPSGIVSGPAEGQVLGRKTSTVEEYLRLTRQLLTE